MKLIINSPTNMQTGKPTGQSWKTGMQSQTNTSRELKIMTQQNVVKPMMANGDTELRINRAPSRTKDGKVAPMAALGFVHNEIGTQALWNRIQSQLNVLDQDEHDFHMLKEVYDDYCIYETDSKLYKRGFKLDSEDMVSLDTTVTEVVEQVSFDELKTHHTHNANNVKPMPALGFNFGK